MKKFLKNFIKEHWWMHLIVGGIIGWGLSLTFDGVPVSIQIFLVLFISAFIGTLWEWLWGAMGKAVVDYRDVLFGSIGALIMYLITLLG